MEPMIAILDDGLHPGLHHAVDFCMDADAGRICESSIQTSSPHHHGHGDVCAAIIRRYAPNARIGSIRILENDRLLGSPRNLIAAVDWCVAHHIDLVHMSLGSIEPGDCLPLYDCMKRASDAGLILVAACNNERQIAFPASFPFVIGVKTCADLKDDEYAPNPEPFSGIDFIASSNHALDGGLLHNRTPICNSFAAPLITAKAANLLQREPLGKMEDIKKRLIEMGKPPMRYPAAWDCSGVMDVRGFAQTMPSLDGNACGGSDVPVIAIAGESACAGIEALARTFLKNHYMPLSLIERGEEKPLFAHWIDSPVEVIKQNAILSGWFGADVILLGLSPKCVEQYPSHTLLPDIFLCTDDFFHTDFCASVLKPGGEALLFGSEPLPRLCMRILHLLTREDA